MAMTERAAVVSVGVLTGLTWPVALQGLLLDLLYPHAPPTGPWLCSVQLAFVPVVTFIILASSYQVLRKYPGFWLLGGAIGGIVIAGGVVLAAELTEGASLWEAMGAGLAVQVFGGVPFAAVGIVYALSVAGASRLVVQVVKRHGLLAAAGTIAGCTAANAALAWALVYLADRLF